MAEVVGRDSRASIEIETESTVCLVELNTTVEMVNALKVMIEEPEPSFSYRYRIGRIPDHLRKVNEQAYSPKVISIGPLHHGDKKLQSLEKIKVGYLKSILNQGRVGLVELVAAVREIEESIWCCYGGASCGMSMGKFLNVILVDAIFVLEFIRTASSKRCRGPDDSLMEDQMDYIVCDLVLLENQLPFFVLEKLFSRIYAYDPNSLLIDLVIKFFQRFIVHNVPPNIGKIVHFTDLIRNFMLGHSQSIEPRETGSGMAILMRSATQLHEAGVKFRVRTTNYLLDITFDPKSGVLEMPCIKLYGQTEALIRNVMAFEQYCFGDKIYVRDYYLFLDRLVNTTRDIDFLCDMGIMHNYLGDNDAAKSLVNKLNIHVCWSGVHRNHYCIFKDLNDFYEKPWHKWKATLRDQYFSTPWRIASTVAAVILLVFTFVQTVCSIVK